MNAFSEFVEDAIRIPSEKCEVGQRDKPRMVPLKAALMVLHRPMPMQPAPGGFAIACLIGR